MLHNINVFFVVLSTVLLIEMGCSRYTKSILTSLERELKLTSKQLGILGAGQQIGDLSVCLIISYFGGYRHRPRIIGMGCLLMVLGALLSAFPHFLIPKHDVMLNYTAHSPALCRKILPQSNLTIPSSDESKISTDTGYYVIILIGQIIFGFGMSPLKPLGFSYIDDHLNRSRSALYLGVLVSTQFAGPIIGFLLSAWTTYLWVDLTDPPTRIDPRNPAWISAWWLGFLIFASVNAVVGVMFFCFPRKIRSKTSRVKYYSKSAEESKGDSKESSSETTDVQCQLYIKDDLSGDQSVTNATSENNVNNDDAKLRQNLTTWSGNPFFERRNDSNTDTSYRKQWQELLSSGKSLLANKLFTLTVTGSVFLWAYIVAYSVFVIKYIEQQFSLTTSRSNVLFGLVSSPFTVLGTIIGGLIINRYKFSLAGIFRYLAVVSGLGLVVHCICYLLVYCDNAEVVTDMQRMCSHNCTCMNRFEPVCAGGVTYFSSCLIGCKVYAPDFLHKTLNFTDCPCIRSGTAISGRCGSNCTSSVTYFMVLNAFGAVMFGSLCSASLVVIMRLLFNKNKPFGLGITLVCNKFLGAIPAPIIAGAIIDEACKVRGLRGGATCILYDLPLFRLYFGTMLFTLKALSFVVFVATAFLTRKDHFRENSEYKQKTIETSRSSSEPDSTFK